MTILGKSRKYLYTNLDEFEVIKQDGAMNKKRIKKNLKGLIKLPVWIEQIMAERKK